MYQLNFVAPLFRPYRLFCNFDVFIQVSNHLFYFFSLKYFFFYLCQIISSNILVHSLTTFISKFQIMVGITVYDLYMN